MKAAALGGNFCSDIELGVKGMSVPTLCRISMTLSLSTDYILFGKQEKKEKLSVFKALSPVVESVAPSQLPYLESVLKAVISAMNHKENK